MWIAIVALFAACVAVAVVGGRAARGELPRNHTAGLRTPATLADDEAWEVGNRVAGPSSVMVGIAGAVATAGAAVVALAGASDGVVAAIVLTITALLAGGVLTGAVRGHRAAKDVLASRER